VLQCQELKITVLLRYVRLGVCLVGTANDRGWDGGCVDGGGGRVEGHATRAGKRVDHQSDNTTTVPHALTALITPLSPVSSPLSHPSLTPLPTHTHPTHTCTTHHHHHSAPNAFAAKHPWSSDLCHTPPNLCDSQGRLIFLSLRDAGLSCAALPQELAALTTLQRLDLGGNEIATTPRQAGAVLSKLAVAELYLSNMKMQGQLDCALIAPRRKVTDSAEGLQQCGGAGAGGAGLVLVRVQPALSDARWPSTTDRPASHHHRVLRR